MMLSIELLSTSGALFNKNFSLLKIWEHLEWKKIYFTLNQLAHGQKKLLHRSVF
jgi:hypothetical protein